MNDESLILRFFMGCSDPSYALAKLAEPEGRMRRTPTLAAEFTIFFLATLCLISIALNIALVLQRNKPDFWKDLRLSFTRVPAVSAMDHVRGRSGASVTVIEYSDYQCPYSRQIHSALKKLTATTPVKWVLRNKPLESIHPLAIAAAVAAECAGKQGQFWQYSDGLFDEQDKLTSEAIFSELASRLGLKIGEFNACRAVTNNLIRTQMAEATALEVSVTPTLFVNGKRFNGALTETELADLLQADLPQKSWR